MQRSKKVGFLESPEAKMFVTMSFPPCGRQTLQCHLGDTDNSSSTLLCWSRFPTSSSSVYPGLAADELDGLEFI